MASAAIDLLSEHEYETIEASELADRLHDEIMQPLLVAKMFVDSCRETSELPSRAKDDLAHTEQLLSLALGKLRSFSNGLLRQQERDRELRRRVEQSASRLLPRIELVWDLEPSFDKLAAREAQIIERIMGSAFANVARHSGADKVTVRFRTEQEHRRLLIDDNGCGISQDRLDVSDSFGSMKRAIKQIEGTIRIEANDTSMGDGGTRVEVEWRSSAPVQEIQSNEVVVDQTRACE